MAGPTIAFFPEGAYGPTNNCVGIGRVLREHGARVVFVVEESFAGTLEAQGFEEALDAVRDALFEAGAGRIGDYERCSWYTAGTGTFLGGEGSAPAIGEAGREERVPELRLETVFPAARHEDVIAALRRAHPYEEPAFDVYPLL